MGYLGVLFDRNNENLSADRCERHLGISAPGHSSWRLQRFSHKGDRGGRLNFPLS